MKKILRIATFGLTFSAMMISFGEAQTCELGNPSSSDYIRRDSNRCEGIRQIEISGGLSLIGLYTYDSAISNNDESILLRIPYTNISNQPANEYIQETRNNYVLNEIDWNQGNSFYYFHLNPQVIEREQISPESLRAYSTSRELGIYIPVIIGDFSKEYKITFLADRPAKINKIYILDIDGNNVWERSSRFFEDGEITFSWDGKDRLGNHAPDGRYQLVYEYQLQNVSEPRTDSEAFVHQIRWLN